MAFLTGTNRDELGIDLDAPPAGANITELFAKLLPGGVGDLSRLINSPEFGFTNSSGGASSSEILSAMIRISTDGLYTCLEHATAYSASKHKVFSSLYSFQFNRTYNPAGYTKPHCNPPKTDARPNGDPNLEYKKCHAGEQMIVFGTVRRDGLPDRDGLDVPYMQLIMDYWASFARTRDPNPSLDYLAARGYWNTISQIQAVGPWIQEVSAPAIRLLQWNGRQVEPSEQVQCQALGLPLEYFEAH